MKKTNRVFAAALAGLLLTAPASSLNLTSGAADAYQMTVTVDTSANRKAISPYIYGVNEYGNGANLENVKVNAVRQGGNRYTGYNWETNWSNAGADWKHSSDTNIGDISDGAGYAARNLSKNVNKYGIPYKMTTLQMAGYVSADKNGEVSEEEAAPSARWNEVKFQKDGELSLEPDTTDNVVYMDEYVNYLVKTLGDASTAEGIQAYSLDNEPVLWNDTHPRMHSEEVTNEELVSKSIELANVVKTIDPKAEVYGPAFWGMLPCMQIGETGNGFTDPQWQAVKSNYNWYMDYYLDQMKQAETEYGKRLIDVFDVHYYAQDVSTDEGILQAARSLYDPEYQENSWLQPWAGGYFPFLTRMQESIDKYYPGTKLAVSEYNLGNIANEKNTGKSVITGIAEAEALGAFALNEVYFATYWGTLPECPYVESAINLYTNYDGKGSSFGDTLVSAETADLSKAAAFASINGEDDSVITMTLSNKDASSEENAVISLTGSDKNYQSAVVYAITQDSSDIKIIDVQNDIENSTLTVTLPALSVAQIVISDKATDAEITEEPDITVKETVYNYADLKLSQNGYPMIPLGDKEHLKEIVINSTATSSEGSSYGGGGGGLCFNKVVPEGETTPVWGSKATSFGLGTEDSIIKFDDKFTIVIDEKGTDVKGTTLDDYAEFQGNWWTYSEKESDGSDITVTYNTIKLVYEYDNSEELPFESESETETESDAPVSGMLGDADENGEINILDVITINKAILGKELLSEQGIKNIDFNQNNKPDSDEALTVMKYIVGLITNFS
ncbi:MAG: glycoside hydrolase [Oscillospiraceae bacterium]|nr:glycoside hydrolase [Oscillospiraceae bacterium]